ncbi:MAG: preprotein translocase subunit YajC [Candidatus Hatepunaea meridiana]|nr:preprotein translocase subunit YajC [Candidatus Hatepunaea meridiana]
MFLLFLAMTQPNGGQGGGGGFGAFLPMILIFVILYFLILRPQAKKQRRHQRMLQDLNKGDRIVTTGGIHGTIVRVNESEKTLIVKVSDDLKLTIDVTAIIRKRGGDGRD